MNNTPNEAPSGAAAGRALKLSTLGLYAVSILVACSSDPSAPTTPIGGFAGAPSAGAANLAGAPSAGAPAAGGDLGTAGALSGGAGGDLGAGGGSAGATVLPPAPPSTFYVDDIQWVAGSAAGAGGAGGAGGAAAGAGGAAAGAGGAAAGAGGAAAGAGGAAAGAGGAPGAMCSTAAQKTLPYTVTDGFVASGYTGGDANQSGGGQLSQAACAVGDRAPGAIGKCTAFTYTPTSPSTWAGIAYLTGAGFGQPGTRRFAWPTAPRW